MLNWPLLLQYSSKITVGSLWRNGDGSSSSIGRGICQGGGSRSRPEVSRRGVGVMGGMMKGRGRREG